MRPNDLAAELGILPKQLRDWLRATYPRGEVAKGQPWHLTADQVAEARRHFAGRRDERLT